MGFDISGIVGGAVQALEGGISEAAGAASNIPDPIAMGIQAVGSAVGLDPKLIALAEMGVGAATGDVMCAIHGVNDIMNDRSKPAESAHPAKGYAPSFHVHQPSPFDFGHQPSLDPTGADAGITSVKDPSGTDTMDYGTAAAAILKNFDLFDTAAGIGGKDGLIAKRDLEAVANDPNAPADAREAAKFFLASPTQLNELDVAGGIGKVDGLIAKCDLEAAAKTASASPSGAASGADGSSSTQGSKKADETKKADDSTPADDTSPTDGTKKADDTKKADNSTPADAATSADDFSSAIDDILNNPKFSVEEKVMMIMAKLSEKQEGRIQKDMGDLANAEKENNAHRGDKDYKQASTQSIQQDLQMAMSRRSELTSFASNFEKMEHEMRTSVINNIR